MDTICIYAKPPVPGRTKSRLARGIGDRAAAELAAAMLTDLCNTALLVTQARVQLWHPPDATAEDFRGCVPTTIAFHAQSGANLGERMSNTFRQVLAEEDGRVLLVGSDCMTFTTQVYDAAFAALSYVPVVLQPANDGGYVLVGQSSWTPIMFERIPWGTRDVLTLTWQQLQKANVRHCELPPTFDVDEPEDLARVLEVEDSGRTPCISDWLRKHRDLITTA